MSIQTILSHHHPQMPSPTYFQPDTSQTATPLPSCEPASLLDAFYLATRTPSEPKKKTKLLVAVVGCVGGFIKPLIGDAVWALPDHLQRQLRAVKASKRDKMRTIETDVLDIFTMDTAEQRAMPGFNDAVAFFGRWCGRIKLGEISERNQVGSLHVGRLDVLQAFQRGLPEIWHHPEIRRSEDAAVFHFQVPTGVAYRAGGASDEEPGLGLVYPVFEEYLFHSPENTAISMRLVYDMLVALQKDLRAAQAKHQFVAMTIPVPNRLSLEQELMNAGYEIRGDEAVLLGTELLNAPKDSWSTRLRKWHVARDAERVTLLPQATAEDYRRLVMQALDAVVEAEGGISFNAEAEPDDDAPQMMQSALQQSSPVPCFRQMVVLPEHSHTGELERVRVIATLDMHQSKLATALYVDGSRSMVNEKYFGASGHTIFGRNFGTHPHHIKSLLRTVVPVLVACDQTGKCRTGYWATGPNGDKIQLIGTLDAEQGAQADGRKPTYAGGQTRLVPLLKDFVRHVVKRKSVNLAYALFVTTGEVVDYTEALWYLQKVAGDVSKGRLPRVHFVGLGLGKDEGLNLLDNLSNRTFASYDDPARLLWSFIRVDDARLMGRELLKYFYKVLPTLYGQLEIEDDAGRTVLQLNRLIPPVIVFDLPPTAQMFKVTLDGQTFEQQIRTP
jgi:hypothetical protein